VQTTLEELLVKGLTPTNKKPQQTIVTCSLSSYRRWS